MKQYIGIVLLAIMLLCPFQSTKAQQGSTNIITGNIYAQSEGGLIGVSIQEIDGTDRVVSGTVTDINGDFSLRIKSPNNKLRFTYIGFTTQTLSIGSRKTFSVEMREDSQVLTAVEITTTPPVRTGTIDIPEKQNPMAMQRLTADFDELSVASLDEALQGRIAGLDIISNSGDVGSGSSMRLRGTASINANVTPLIVVDDLIYDAGNTDNFDFVNAEEENFADLLSINVDDIESITVMKDGASTAIWGSQGANGVISIRTRRGARGKPRLTYTYRLSEKWQPEGMRMLNGDEYTMMLKEAYFNPSHSDNASNIKELNYIQNDIEFPDWRMYDNNTDWVDAVTTHGFTHDHNFTLSGGGEKATFYFSASYFKETGSVIEQNLDRFTSRMNLDYRVSDRILFKADMSFTHSNQDKNYEGLLNIAYKKMPNLAIYKEEENGVSTGEFYTTPRSMSSELEDQRGLRNPVAVGKLAKNNVKSYRLMPNFTLQYDLLPYEEYSKLRLKGIVSFDIKNNSSYSFLPKELSSIEWTNGDVNKVNNGSDKSFQTRGVLNITWQPNFLPQDHSLTLFAEGIITSGDGKSQSEASYGVPAGIGSPTTGSYVSGMGTSSWAWKDLLFRHTGHYSYKDKYSFNYSLTRQGNSKFGEKRKFGTFGGASFRWNLSEEDFMKGTRDWMSMLALRFSAGVTGNAPKDDYLHFSRYESWSSYLGIGTIRPVNIQLKDLRWEKTVDWNVGLNVGFFNDKLTGTFNYYDKETSDLLQKDVTIPSSSGFGSYQWQNVGTVRNQGWELFLDLNRIVQVGKFSMNVNFNFANNRNKVEKLNDIVLGKYNGEYGYQNGEYMSRLQLGNSLGSIYGFRYKGVYEYNIDNPNLIASGYTLGTAPVARDGQGNVIYDSNGNAVPMYFAYGTTNELQFQGGDAIYEDINNDGNINELDIVYLGNSNPKLNGGMGIKLTYDRFSINVYSVFRYGNKIVNEARMNAENMHSNNNQSRAVNWRWRKEGDKTDIPRALKGAGRNYLGSDRFVENGSFWRIRQLSFNYSIPPKLLSKVSISQVNLFLTIYNLYCFTNYSGVDPEVGYGSWGVSKDNAQTPRSKSYTAGVTVRF